MLINHNKVIMLRTNQSLENSYDKTISTIKSCKTKTQLEGASRMVKNFKNLYKKVGYPKTISYSLDETLKQQYIITRCQL
jgi:hypothetical protein